MDDWFEVGFEGVAIVVFGDDESCISWNLTLTNRPTDVTAVYSYRRSDTVRTRYVNSKNSMSAAVIRRNHTVFRRIKATKYGRYGPMRPSWSLRPRCLLNRMYRRNLGRYDLNLICRRSHLVSLNDRMTLSYGSVLMATPSPKTTTLYVHRYTLVKTASSPSPPTLVHSEEKNDFHQISYHLVFSARSTNESICPC